MKRPSLDLPSTLLFTNLAVACSQGASTTPVDISNERSITSEGLTVEEAPLRESGRIAESVELCMDLLSSDDAVSQCGEDSSEPCLVNTTRYFLTQAGEDGVIFCYGVMRAPTPGIPVAGYEVVQVNVGTEAPNLPNDPDGMLRFHWIQDGGSASYYFADCGNGLGCIHRYQDQWGTRNPANGIYDVGERTSLVDMRVDVSAKQAEQDEFVRRIDEVRSVLDLKTCPADGVD